jgi:uncharacterized membrane protein
MTRKYYLIGILLTAALLVAILIAYPQLPNQVPTHWNMKGQANDYSAKWALFLIGPGLMAGTMLLFYFLPWLSPKQWQVDTFQSTYLYIMLVLVSMLAYFTGVTLWAVSAMPQMSIGPSSVGSACCLLCWATSWEKFVGISLSESEPPGR